MRLEGSQEAHRWKDPSVQAGFQELGLTPHGAAGTVNAVRTEPLPHSPSRSLSRSPAG